jgi:hypothetical protein
MVPAAIAAAAPAGVEWVCVECEDAGYTASRSPSGV